MTSTTVNSFCHVSILLQLSHLLYSNDDVCVKKEEVLASYYCDVSLLFQNCKIEVCRDIELRLYMDSATLWLIALRVGINYKE